MRMRAAGQQRQALQEARSRGASQKQLTNLAAQIRKAAPAPPAKKSTRSVVAARAAPRASPDAKQSRALLSTLHALHAANGLHVRSHPKYRHLFSACGACIPPPKPFVSAGLTNFSLPVTSTDKFLYFDGATSWREINLAASGTAVIWTNPYSHSRPLAMCTDASLHAWAAEWGTTECHQDGGDFRTLEQTADWITPNPLETFGDPSVELGANNYAYPPSATVRPPRVQWLGGALDFELAVPYNGMCAVAATSAYAAGVRGETLGIPHWNLADAMSPVTLAYTYGRPTQCVGATPTAALKMRIPLEHDSRWYYPGDYNTTDAPADAYTSMNAGLFPRSIQAKFARGFIVVVNTSASSVTIRARMHGTFAIVPVADDSVGARNPIINYLMKDMTSVGPPTNLPAYLDHHRTMIPVGSASRLMMPTTELCFGTAFLPLSLALPLGLSRWSPALGIVYRLKSKLA
jgi:hypothetical protein